MKSIPSLILLTSVLTLVLAATPNSLSAQETTAELKQVKLAQNSGAATGLDKARNAAPGLPTTNLTAVITNVIKALLSLVGIITVGALVWGGVMMILSAGNENRLSKAKSIIIWALVGLAVVVLSYIIVSAIATVLSGGSL